MDVGFMERIETTPDVTVRLIKSNTNDMDVVRAARVSTLGADTELGGKQHGAKGLINFLMRDRHGSPFEHTTMTFFIQAPIFVFREFHRHRAGWSYNEESGRYKTLEPMFYKPGTDRNLVQIGKPGAYTFEPGTGHHRFSVVNNMNAAYAAAWLAYSNMLRDGVAREVARMVLPLGIFSSMYATCNSRSLMHFLSLRTKDDRAKVPSFPQREIEMVAEGMEREWAQLMPFTHEAFNAHGRVAP
jgi:thymidylate synthase (FAD)